VSAFWQANLRALAARPDPWSQALVRELGDRGPAPDLGLRSRDGRVLPGLAHEGRPRSLVSTFDAAKEAQRWAEGIGGAVAVFGAAGRDALGALRSAGVTISFWVEPRPEVWRSLLTWEDWSDVADAADWIPVCGTPADWEAALTGRYHPLWDGAFRTLEWRSATAGAGEPWNAYRQAAVRALAAVAGDASTQARFGERWYRNSLANLRRLAAGRVEACPGARVVVAGAGPGLDDALANADNQRWLDRRPATGDKLFATDTALPALSARGVVPDLVLCLDGQLPTYHHFVKPRPAGVPLVADLSSIPLLGRLGMPVVRYLSGHPFGIVVRRFFPELPGLDGSLGNVSGLALRTAQALGARTVDAWGADFCYRDGQAYAHGTYVYDLAARHATRLEPMESRLGASCYAAAGLERTRDSRGRALDTTPLLRDYRRRWVAPAPAPARVSLAHGAAGARWGAFADHWRARLASLPLPQGSMHAFLLSQPGDTREDWLALWPLALALHRQGVAAPEAARAARDRAAALLDEQSLLTSGGDRRIMGTEEGNRAL